jgi:hypothetical protein
VDERQRHACVPSRYFGHKKNGSLAAHCHAAQ